MSRRVLGPFQSESAWIFTNYVGFYGNPRFGVLGNSLGDEVADLRVNELPVIGSHQI